MPIYEYACEACGNKFEKLVRRTDDVLAAGCPSCGQRHLTQEFSTFAPRAGSASVFILLIQRNVRRFVPCRNVRNPRTVGPELIDAQIVSPAAQEFLQALHRKFNDRRVALLERRAVRQQEIDEGKLPDFLEETRQIRESDWTVAPIPADLKDRRTEITGPTDRKMVINALNSGAMMFMADFEDANAPTLDNLIEGQRNLSDAIRRTISFSSPEGKQYKLNEKTAVLLVRPRGWHMVEKHFPVDGQPISGGLFDFGLYYVPQCR